MKKYDIMSAREPCACTNGERRMSIMIVAKQRRARSADHDIMSAREPMCLHNRRTANVDHDSCEATKSTRVRIMIVTP